MYNSSVRAQSNRLKIALLGSLLVNFGQLVPSARTEGLSNQPNGEVQLQLRNATSTLDTLETSLNTIEKQKIVTLSESDKISQGTLDYAKAAKSALDIALKDAESLAKSKGVRGNIASLETFEKTEKANKPRLEKIGLRADAVVRKIRSGDIRLAAPAIERLSVPQRREFLDSLEAPARREYIRREPALFKPALEIQGQGAMSSGKSFSKYLYFSNGVSSSIEMMKNTSLSVPDLYARAAIPCIPLAKNKDWAKLAICVANAGQQAQAAYNDFTNCWNNTKKWQVLQRAKCLAEFIAKLA